VKCFFHKISANLFVDSLLSLEIGFFSRIGDVLAFNLNKYRKDFGLNGSSPGFTPFSTRTKFNLQH
jgi:hypothetical protein